MSITFTYNSVTYTASELFHGTSATDQDGGPQFPRVWQVHASSPNIHPITLITAAYAQRTPGTVTFSGRLPVRRDVSNGFACQSVKVTVDESDDRTYLYQAEFAIDRFGGSSSPIDDPPEITWGGIETSEIYDIDADGKAVTNTVRERFEPQPERVAGQDAVTIVQNRATWSPSMGSMYSYTTNDASLWSGAVAAGQARMGRIEAVKVREEGITFWRVSFPITFRNSWLDEFLNVGTRIAVGPDEYESITVSVPQTGQRVPVPQPVLISLDGSSVYTGTLTGTNVPTVSFRPYRSANWAPLNLPSPF